MPSVTLNSILAYYPYADAVYLPLRRGENELLLAVTEFFGGWAFQCQILE